MIKTRMDKYHKTDEYSRTNKNKEVYETMYDNLYEEAAYSNVTILDNSSEIDVSRIKDMINERENFKTIKRYKDVIDVKLEPKLTKSRVILDDYEEKEYDINKILEDAKSKRSFIEDQKEKAKLYNSNYIVSSLSGKNKEVMEQKAKQIYQDLVNEETALLDLMNTISVNKKKIEEGLLDDLKGDGESDKSFENVMEDLSSEDDTSSGFDNEDFLDDSEKARSNKLEKVIMYVLIAIIILVCYFIIDYFFL